MLEDTVINEFRVKPISPEKVVSSVDGETAYSLETIPHGKCVMPTKEEEMISNIPVTDTTIGDHLVGEGDVLRFVVSVV